MRTACRPGYVQLCRIGAASQIIFYDGFAYVTVLRTDESIQVAQLVPMAGVAKPVAFVISFSLFKAAICVSFNSALRNKSARNSALTANAVLVVRHMPMQPHDVCRPEMSRHTITRLSLKPGGANNRPEGRVGGRAWGSGTATWV
jgi:hypothetical protein